MDDFDWADLAHERAQGRHVIVIEELTNEDFECVHIEKGHSEFVCMTSH